MHTKNKAPLKDSPLGLTLLKSIEAEKGLFNELAWSPCGQRMIMACSDTCVYLWEYQKNEPPIKLSGHNEQVFSVAWSPNGKTFVSASASGELLLWDVETLKFRRLGKGIGCIIWKVCWNHSKNIIATAADDGSIMFWNPDTGELIRSFEDATRQIFSADWSQNGKMIGFGCVDGTVLIGDVDSNRLIHSFKSDVVGIRSVAWHPTKNYIIAGSNSGKIEYIDVEKGQCKAVLEGHTGMIYSLSFSADGKLLISKSDDGTIRFWDFKNLRVVALLQCQTSGVQLVEGLSFNPITSNALLAVRGEHDRTVNMWRYDLTTLLNSGKTSNAHHYRNSKVVLMGNSGVGKSGLHLVLRGHRFEATESTHARTITMLEHSQILREDKSIESRETLLWDLAGQRNYSLLHQLHLNEVNVAIIVFDPGKEKEPLEGVRYWIQALRQSCEAQQFQNIKKILVAARTDRGGMNITHQTALQISSELGFDAFFKTSAKEGTEIQELIEFIRTCIDWEKMPITSSTDLFHKIKTFLRLESQGGLTMITSSELFRSFLRDHSEYSDLDNLKSIFDSCLDLVESQGFIHQLSFGGLILLRPELLDCYASSIINAARAENLGLGSVSEEAIFAGDFFIPTDERVQEKDLESLLIIATVEELKRHEIAFKEDGYLIFPSEFTRELTINKVDGMKSVVFKFKGALDRTYATLIVKLCRGGPFVAQQLWRNAAVFSFISGGSFSLSWTQLSDGIGEFSLYFDEKSDISQQILFEDYITNHLERCEYLSKRKVYICHECCTEFSERQIQKRKNSGFIEINCPVCDIRTSLIDNALLSEQEQSELKLQALRIDALAKSKAEETTADTILKGKKATEDYDVFICYNKEDWQQVEEIYSKLKERGILPWIDFENIRPGSPWISELENIMSLVKTAAVFLGSSKEKSWQDEEIQKLLRISVQKGIRVIPVLLKNAPETIERSTFLSNNHVVDFRIDPPSPIEQLIWGITGRKSNKKYRN